MTVRTRTPLRARSDGRRRFRQHDLTADLAQSWPPPDICSKHWIWRAVRLHGPHQYGGGPGRRRGDRARQGDRHFDRHVARRQRPLLLSDPRAKARSSIVAECCRNLSTVGALPVAATNNLNFGNPERPEIMAQLVEAIEGMAEACRFFDTPDYGRQCQPVQRDAGRRHLPDAGDGIVGLMKTAAPVTIDFKNAGPRDRAARRTGRCG